MPRRIAIVAQIPVFPTTAGNRARLLTLIEALHQLGHEVILIQIPSGPYDAPESVEHHEELLGGGNYYDLRTLSAPARWAGWLRVLPVRAISRLSRLMGIETNWRYWRPLDSHISPETRRAVHRIIRVRGCDCCMVEYVFHSAVLKNLPGNVLKLIDTHDLFTNRHMSYAANGLGASYWVSLRPGEEARGLMRADGVMAIQADEAKEFARVLAGNPHAPMIRVVSHFMPRVEPIAHPGAAHRAAFVASSNDANVQALSFFLDRILPEVLERDPAFRLVLAGSICDAAPDHPQMDKFGRFNRIGDVFAQAPISLNPVLNGSGIAIKALESLAAGVPVVATRTGARGLEALAGEGLRVLPDGDWRAYAEALAELTRDPERRTMAGRQALAAAKDWNRRQQEGLEDLLRQSPDAARLNPRSLCRPSC